MAGNIGRPRDEAERQEAVKSAPEYWPINCTIR